MDKTSSTAAAKPAKSDDTKAAKSDDTKAAKSDDTKAAIPAATTFSTSGAPVQLSGDIDIDSPAVDNDPRAGTTALQNKIDFNDPTIEGSEAVERNLKSQG